MTKCNTLWLMAPGGSMPHSQGLSDGSNPEPNQPHSSTYFFKVHSNIVFPLRLGLPKGLFLVGILVPVKNFESTPTLFHSGYITCQSLSSRRNDRNYIR